MPFFNAFSLKTTTDNESSYSIKNDHLKHGNMDASNINQNIMNPVFSGNECVGFKLQPKNVSTFLSRIANYSGHCSQQQYQHWQPQPPSFYNDNDQKNLNSDSHSFEISNEVEKIFSFLSHYCWTNKKSLIPATEPGLFLCQDIRDNLSTRPSTAPESKLKHRICNENTRESTLFPHPHFYTHQSPSSRPLFSFSSPDFHYCKRKVTSPKTNSNYSPTCTQSRKRSWTFLNFADNDKNAEEIIDWKHYEKNQHLFHPQILCLHNLPHRPFPSRFSHNGCCCNNTSPKQKGFNGNDATSNRIKANFPPSIRHDFLQLQINSFKKDTLVGNLPFKIESLSVENNDKSKGITIFSSQVPTEAKSIDIEIKQQPQAPLNYDEYLKKFAEIRNRQKDLQYIFQREEESNKLKERLKMISEEDQDSRNQSGTDKIKSSKWLKWYTRFLAREPKITNESKNKRHKYDDAVIHINQPPEEQEENFTKDQLTRKKPGPTIILNSFHGRKILENLVQDRFESLAYEEQSQRCQNFPFKTQRQKPDTYLNTSNSNFTTKPKHTKGKKSDIRMKIRLNFPIKSRRPRSRYLSLLAETRCRCQDNKCQCQCRCQVTLTKCFYYCEPPISTLNLLVDHSGHCFVQDFRVGHEQYGHVTFHGKVDVFGLNLDAIVEFKLKEFNLYPNECDGDSHNNDDDHPVPFGHGLKRSATVVMFNVWPLNDKKTNFIRDLNEIKNRKYEELLQKSCVRTGAHFLSYDPYLGHWTFKV